MAFQELMEIGGLDDRRQLQQLQNELQSDDPINIQFTSVSNSYFLHVLHQRSTCNVFGIFALPP